MILLNKKQAGELIGVGVKSIQAYMNKGLPYYKRIGAYIYIDGDKIPVPKSVNKDRVLFIESEIIKWITNK